MLLFCSYNLNFLYILFFSLSSCNRKMREWNFNNNLIVFKKSPRYKKNNNSYDEITVFNRSFGRDYTIRLDSMFLLFLSFSLFLSFPTWILESWSFICFLSIIEKKERKKAKKKQTTIELGTIYMYFFCIWMNLKFKTNYEKLLFIYFNTMIYNIFNLRATLEINIKNNHFVEVNPT